MGDLNDEPDKESLTQFLGTKNDTDKIAPNDLINTMYFKMNSWNEGTIKYQGEWSIFDQFIISGNLLSGLTGISTTLNDVHIFRAPFLTEKDEKNFGVKLKRTYAGPRYIGGFSDHLPVYLDIRKKNKNPSDH